MPAQLRAAFTATVAFSKIGDTQSLNRGYDQRNQKHWHTATLMNDLSDGEKQWRRLPLPALLSSTTLTITYSAPPGHFYGTLLFPFGGKLTLFVVCNLGGDFHQTLPAIQRGTKTDLINNCIKNSNLWNQYQKFSLLDNMRTINGDANWIKFLLDVGDGAANDYEDRVNLPEGVPDSEDHVDDEYLSRDEVEDESTNKYITTEILNYVWTSSLRPHRLRLKVGSFVMLLRNLDVISGMFSDTRFIAKELKRKCILCTFATGCKKGKDTLKRTQFPAKSESTKHRDNRLEELDSTSRKTSFCSRTDMFQEIPH
uniref:ATP-dependent DNA helicase n=1 Tax=Caenorhabditis japonica TaxID=281687 RepID=A0A8R1EGS3_CAEJA